jgi:hypothetical protein
MQGKQNDDSHSPYSMQKKLTVYVSKLPGPDVAVHPIHQPNVHVKTWATNNLSSNPSNKKKNRRKT